MARAKVAEPVTIDLENLARVQLLIRSQQLGIHADAFAFVVQQDWHELLLALVGMFVPETMVVEE